MQHKGPYSYDTRKLCAHLCRELYTQANTGRTRNMICRRLARGLRKEKQGKKQKAEALALRQLTRPQKPRCVGVIDFAIRRGPFYRFVGALPPRDGYSASLGVAGPLTRWPRVTQGKMGGAERYTTLTLARPGFTMMTKSRGGPCWQVAQWHVNWKGGDSIECSSSVLCKAPEIVSQLERSGHQTTYPIDGLQTQCAIELSQGCE